MSAANYNITTRWQNVTRWASEWGQLFVWLSDWPGPVWSGSVRTLFPCWRTHSRPAWCPSASWRRRRRRPTHTARSPATRPSRSAESTCGWLESSWNTVRQTQAIFLLVFSPLFQDAHVSSGSLHFTDGMFEFLFRSEAMKRIKLVSRHLSMSHSVCEPCLISDKEFVVWEILAWQNITRKVWHHYFLLRSEGRFNIFFFLWIEFHFSKVWSFKDNVTKRQQTLTQNEAINNEIRLKWNESGAEWTTHSYQCLPAEDRQLLSCHLKEPHADQWKKQHSGFMMLRHARHIRIVCNYIVA